MWPRHNSHWEVEAHMMLKWGAFITARASSKLMKNIIIRAHSRFEFQIKHSNPKYRIVASTNTCYYSENQIFHFLKSRIVTCQIFFLEKNFLICEDRKILKIVTWQTYEVTFFSAHSDNKQKRFIPKKNCGMLLFETLKTKKSDFLNNNTC